MDTVTQTILEQLAATPTKGVSSSFGDKLNNLSKLSENIYKRLTDANELFLFQSLIDQIPDFLFVKDRAGKFVIANYSIKNVYGLPDHLVGKTDYDLHPLARAEEFHHREQEIMETGIPQYDIEESFPNGEGVTRWYSTTKVPLRDAAGMAVGLIGIARDVTERKRMEEQLVHMAHYDPLTKLSNRIVCMNRLKTALTERGLKRQKVALLYIDLDNFKHVNDSLGHQLGDVFLQHVSDRLREVVTIGNTVSRLGGDEFAVIQVLEVSQGRSESAALAKRIIAALSVPYNVRGHHVVAGATIGVAVAPEDDNDPDALLRDADLALYQAKGDKRGGVCFFEPEMNIRAQQRRLLETDLRHALAVEEFELHYQPLIDLVSGEVCGFEALIRWRHPDRGLVCPADFIPVAEEIGVIIPIGEWVLRQACKQAVLWPAGTKVAVNLSPVQFSDDRLFRTVVSALSSSGLSPECLELEITESVVLIDSDANRDILNQIRALGVQVSLDDFGTGYASLSYLQSFPFTKIKIDRSFIRDLETNPGCPAIIRAVSRLATDLGMKTVVEGIETQQQLDRIRAEGCNEGQGYLFSRPVPANETASLLRSFPQFRAAA